QIQAKSGQAPAVMTAGTQVVDEGLRVIDAASRSLQTIRQSADQADETLSSVVRMVGDLESGHRRLGSNMSQVVAGTEHSAAGAQQVAATASEQADSVREIANQAQALLAMAQALEGLADGTMVLVQPGASGLLPQRLPALA
ncbi:MAG: hypothetical protein H7338_07810, partial [Candidatus Sericytochromatia bacterium]|nr:hypothetical protein [Candidatus Sericytochromatia bacterium]